MKPDEAKAILEPLGCQDNEQKVALFVSLMNEMCFMRCFGSIEQFTSNIEQYYLRKAVSVRGRPAATLTSVAMLAVEITEVEIGLDQNVDPLVTVYNVVLWMPMGTWSETFGSKDEMFAFLRGIKAVTFSAGLKVKWPRGYGP
jgi:hypothetical protein